MPALLSKLTRPQASNGCPVCRGKGSAVHPIEMVWPDLGIVGPLIYAVCRCCLASGLTTAQARELIELQRWPR